MQAAATTIPMFALEVAREHLQDQGWRCLAADATTRVGTLDLVMRRIDTIAFTVVREVPVEQLSDDVYQLVDTRERHRTRRCAVAWMATNPSLQRGVRRYRFDVLCVGRDRTGALTHARQITDAF